MKGKTMLSKITNNTAIICVTLFAMTLSFSVLAKKGDNKCKGPNCSLPAPAPAPAASGTFTYDGHYDASEYDIDFDLTYKWDGKEITGGKLAFAQDGNQQYMYIAHPLGFVDLSYGTDSNQMYRVGWGNQDDGGRKLKKIYDSEFMNFNFDKSVLTGTSDSGLYIDLDTEGKSTNGPRGASDGRSFYTTFDYNHSIIGSDNDGNIKKFASHSPETIQPVDILDCANEKSSDPSCYALKDIADNKDGDGNLYDWDFNYGVEISLGEHFFSDLLSLTAGNFGFNDTNSLINLASLHASDPKISAMEKHGQEKCADGTNPDHDPCGVSVTPPTEVPEPATFAIFALALGLLRLQAKRRNA